MNKITNIWIQYTNEWDGNDSNEWDIKKDK